MEVISDAKDTQNFKVAKLTAMAVSRKTVMMQVLLAGLSLPLMLGIRASENPKQATAITTSCQITSVP